MEGIGDPGETLPDILQILGRVIRHDQEGVTDGLDRGVDVVEQTQGLTLVVEGEIKADAVTQDIGGDAVDIVEVFLIVIVIGAVIEGINIGDHVTVAFGDGVPIIGRKILKLTLETGDTPGRRIGWR